MYESKDNKFTPIRKTLEIVEIEHEGDFRSHTIIESQA